LGERLDLNHRKKKRFTWSNNPTRWLGEWETYKRKDHPHSSEIRGGDLSMAFSQKVLTTKGSLYCGFIVYGQCYLMSPLLFGLKASPAGMTQATRAIVLRIRGKLSGIADSYGQSIYIDDVLVGVYSINDSVSVLNNGGLILMRSCRGKFFVRSGARFHIDRLSLLALAVAVLDGNFSTSPDDVLAYWFLIHDSHQEEFEEFRKHVADFREDSFSSQSSIEVVVRFNER
jgi:hypothetical protein